MSDGLDLLSSKVDAARARAALDLAMHWMQAKEVMDDGQSHAFSESIWRSRAMAMAKAAMIAAEDCYPALAARHDGEHWREMLTLDFMIRKAMLEGESSFASLWVMSLPGFDRSTIHQKEVVHEQHGYLQMMLCPVMDIAWRCAEVYCHEADPRWRDMGEALVKACPINPARARVDWTDLDHMKGSWRAAVARAAIESELPREGPGQEAARAGALRI